MDQAVEAVMALTVFIVAALILYAIVSSVYAYRLNLHVSSAAGSVAELIATSIVRENGEYPSTWEKWTPSTDLSQYASTKWAEEIDYKPQVEIRAECVQIGKQLNLESLWVKKAGSVSGECARAFRRIPLDDGTFVILEVRVK